MTNPQSVEPQRLVIEIPKPHFDGMPTERDDWVQALMEAAMSGMRSWMNGAQLYCEPTVYIDPEITPKGVPVTDKESVEPGYCSGCGHMKQAHAYFGCVHCDCVLGAQATADEQWRVHRLVDEGYPLQSARINVTIEMSADA